MPADTLASLPDGHGALIAVVIDDVGGPDTYLGQYLDLGVPLTFAVLPMSWNAASDDRRVVAAGKQVLLHIPLPVPPNRDAPGGIGLDASDADIASYLDGAVARVPDAIGSNNHEGSLGTTDAALMGRLLRALEARHLFFLDSVTTQQTLGFATELALGMAPRINNVFLDNNEASEPAQLIQLARLAAKHGTAIGIGHVTRPWLLRALQEGIATLQDKGYRFAPLSEVTNGLAGGLDAGVRTAL